LRGWISDCVTQAVGHIVQLRPLINQAIFFLGHAQQLRRDDGPLL
jgi:hypothetical protein